MLLQSSIDPTPVIVERRGSVSPFVLVCEHAGLAVPAALGDLGLAGHHWNQHIASDLGAKSMAHDLAQQLSSDLIYQQYSRLVIDCNRTYRAESLIPEASHGTEIPGNMGLNDKERMARIEEIHAPFHQKIAQVLGTRKHRGVPTVLASIHSFTPKLGDEIRPWHVGVQYATNTAFASIVLRILRENAYLCVGDNQPWPVSNIDDYTIPVHGDEGSIPCVMIEVRQDLIATRETQSSWAERLFHTFSRASREYYSSA